MADHRSLSWPRWRRISLLGLSSAGLLLGTAPWSARAVETAEPAPSSEAVAASSESTTSTVAPTTTTAAPSTTVPPAPSTTVPPTPTSTVPPVTTTTTVPPVTSSTTAADTPPAAELTPASPPARVAGDAQPPPPASPVPFSPVLVPPEPAAPGAPAESTEEPLPPAGGDDSQAPTPGSGPFPDHLQALTDSVQRSGSSSTSALLDALAPLGRFGLSPEEAALAGFGRFPVAGTATYSHDWWFPRFGPGWRLHEGTDVFAARGTPVRAPADGTARIRNGGLGGLSVYVIEPDGTYYYLAHLAGTAPDLVDGGPVRTGQVVGFVGDSGNAEGGLPHVHVEIHPQGGGPVDPKPVLDQFLTDALAAAPAVIDAYAKASEASDVTSAVLPAPRAGRLPLAGAPRSALLWASAASPSGGALRLAQAEALRAAAAVAGGARPVASSAAQGRAEGELRAWLAPLVPPALATVVD